MEISGYRFKEEETRVEEGGEGRGGEGARKKKIGVSNASEQFI